jgi:membrane associated rhomboid family serine protease
MGVLSALLGASAAALIEPSLLRPLTLPLAGGFAALVLLPSLALLAGRAFARGRRYGRAAPLVRVGALLVGNPLALRNEAAFYRSLDAAEAGDAAACRAELHRLAEYGSIPRIAGGEVLGRVLPLAVERRWADILAALDESDVRAPTLRVFEARAAAETGNLLRAVEACDALSGTGGPDSVLAQAGRTVLAVAGRADFLERAREQRLPVATGPDGRLEMALGRASEGAGRADRARAYYEEARSKGPRLIVEDAERGIGRCRDGEPKLASLDPEERAAVERLEARLERQEPLPYVPPWYRRSAATLAITIVTTIATLASFLVLGLGPLDLLAAGALSAPLVLGDGEGEVWRLGSYALLHGGGLHLFMNAASIVVVGIVLERRIGAARTLVVYLASAVLAGLASLWINDTSIGVGASGGALGLVGALLVVVLRRRSLFTLQERAGWSRILWLTVIATAAIGVAEHQVMDNAAHAAGLLVGAATALLLDLGKTLRPASPLAVRALAGVLCAAFLGCGAAAALQAPRWYAWRTVRVEGASAELPGWIRVAPKGAAEAWAARLPMDLVVQLGSEPGAEPDLVAIVYGEAGAGYSPERPEPQRLFRRGRAFALALLPDYEDARRVFGPAVERLRETLEER